MRGVSRSDAELAMAVGARVAELRLLLGWTQLDLAKRARLGRANVARLERGVHAPSLPLLRNVAHALGFDLAGLLAGVDRRVGESRDGTVRRIA